MKQKIEVNTKQNKITNNYFYITFLYPNILNFRYFISTKNRKIHKNKQKCATKDTTRKKNIKNIFTVTAGMSEKKKRK